MNIFITGIISVIFLIQADQQDTISFTIAPESEVYYTADIRIALVASSTIEGRNSEVNGTIEWVETGTRPEINAELVIDASAFDSGHNRRDDDVRDILNVDEYPEITFELQSVLGLDDTPLTEIDDNYIATGFLTVHGTTNEVRVPVEIKYSDGVLTIEGSTLSRYTDFGIDPPRVGGFVSRAPDELRLHVKLVAERDS